MNKEIRQIGSWVLELTEKHILGEGGMGKVYLAKHSTLETPVAIKLLPEVLVNDQEFNKRFFEEAKMQARLRHPNIAQVMDCIIENGQLFLVIEYLEGGTIADAIEKAKSGIGEKQALKWIKQVLDALNYAHQNGIIHRDIKSTNIMLDQHGNAKVVDFGIAIEMSNNRFTKTGISVGTPHYMSPEQIRRPKDVDHRTDVYSTSIVFYELLTGKVPFDGDSDFDIKDAQVKQIPPSLRQLNPNISSELEEVILRGLAKDPRQRYSGCGEFLQVIENYKKDVANKSSKITSVPSAKTNVELRTTTKANYNQAKLNYKFTQQTIEPSLQPSITEEVKPSENPNLLFAVRCLTIGAISLIVGGLCEIVLFVITGIVFILLSLIPLIYSVFSATPLKEDPQSLLVNQEKDQNPELPANVMWEFVHIKAGEFNMGSNHGEEDEKPIHKVKISKNYELGKCPVTQEQWKSVMGNNPSYFKGEFLPVESISWDNIQEFIRELNKLSSRYIYDLPTEAEWEYAARAGAEGEFLSDLDKIAWYENNSENSVHEIGSKRENAWGLYDMWGNVSEWCLDWYEENYYKTRPLLDIDPKGANLGVECVIRGGSWESSSNECRPAYRDHHPPSECSYSVGFRLLRRPKAILHKELTD